MVDSTPLKEFMREGIPRIRKIGSPTRQQFVLTTYGKSERIVSEKLYGIGFRIGIQVVQRVFALLHEERTRKIIGHTLCYSCENIVTDRQERIMFLVPAKIKRVFDPDRSEFANYRVPIEGEKPYATLCGENISEPYYDSMSSGLYDDAIVKSLCPGVKICQNYSRRS